MNISKTHNQAYIKYIGYLGLSLLLTTLGTYCGGFLIPYLTKQLLIGYCIMSLVLVIGFCFSSGELKKILFYVFTFGEGIMLSPILSIMTKVSIYKCLGITTGIVIIFALLGLLFKNLSFMGNILFGLLISLLGLTILSMFVPLPFLAYLGLGIFCLYLMYDINKFKLDSQYGYYMDDDMILNAVIVIYLDILNILLYIIEIFGDSDD